MRKLLRKLLLTSVAVLLIGTSAQAFDLAPYFSPGVVMQCGDLKVFKTSDGKMAMVDATTGHPKYEGVPLQIEVRGQIIYLNDKPCVMKCEQSATC